MPSINTGVYESLLSRFPNISKKKEIAQELAELTEIQSDQFIDDCLLTLSDQEERELLSDQTLKLIILYLKNKQHDDLNTDLLFNVFSKASLLKLTQAKDTLHSQSKSSPSRFHALMEGICLYNLSDKFFQDSGYIHFLLHVNPIYFNDQNGVSLLNKLQDDVRLGDVVIYNLILEEAATEAPDCSAEHTTLATKKLGDHIKKWRKVYDALMVLFDFDLKPQTILRFTSYEIILNLDPSWLDPGYNKIIKNLDKSLLTADGIKFVLQHITPKDLTKKDINLINLLVKKFIHFSQPNWQAIQEFFPDSLSEFRKLFNRFIYTLNIFQKLNQDASPLFNEPRLILLLDDARFAHNNILKIIPFFSIEANNLSKSSIIKKLLQLNIEIDNEYIQLLNAVLKKLEYEIAICELTNVWLTKEGLLKLNKFSPKYLSPSGILLINKLSKDIDEELIEEMNKCEDHATLVTHLNNESGSNADMIGIAKNHTMKIRKVDELIQQLKQKGTLVIQDRKRANTDAMLTDECPFSFLLPISNQDPDAIIRIDEKSKPLTYSILNENLFLIKQPSNDHDIIAQKKCLISCLGKPYPQLNHDIREEDIDSFNKNTIDLAYLNQKLKLILNEKTDHEPITQDQITWLTELKNSPHLGTIPDVFFTDSRLLLLHQLNSDFISKPHLLTYLEKIAIHIRSSEEVEELNKHIHSLDIMMSKAGDQLPEIFFEANYTSQLINLDISYFTNIDRLHYLKKVIGNTINNTVIIKLNYLFAYGIFLDLSPELFHKIPIAWFHKEPIIKFLSSLSSEAMGDLVMKGSYEFALQSIQYCMDIFKHQLSSVITDAELIHLLNSYQSHADFRELLRLMENNLTLDFIKQSLFKSENKALYHTIYRSCSLYLPQFSQSEFYLGLRLKVKHDCIEELTTTYPSLTTLLSELNGKYHIRVRALEGELENYALEHFNQDKQGNFTTKWTLSSKDKLKAHQDIRHAILNKKTYRELIEIITEHADTIQASNHVFSAVSDLQDIISDFFEGVQRGFRQVQSLTPSTETFVAACLLDDNFCSFMTHKENRHFVINFSKIYFRIFEVYRPKELLDLIKQSKFKELHEKFLDLQEKEKDKKSQKDDSLVKKKETHSLSETNSLVMQPKRIALLPQRIECPRDYQLQDPDIDVGIHLLRNILRAHQILDDMIYKISIEHPNNNHFSIHPSIPAHHNIIFIPFGNIVQNEKNKSCNVIDMVCENSINHPGTMCVGVFNIHTNHNLLILLYTPPKSHTRVFILDPAYPSQEKMNTLEEIKEIFNSKLAGQCRYINLDFIQQFNDSDCGIACLQNIDDIIQHGAITVSNNELTIHRDKFRLDAHRYINKEQDFVSLTIQVRKEWEGKLAQQHACYFNDGSNDILIGPYSFEKNKTLQKLTNHLEELLSEVAENFRESCGRAIYQFFDAHPDIPVNVPEELVKKVLSYIENNKSCHQYFDILKQVNEITAIYPSERINFNESTLKNNLLKQIQHIYCDKHYEKLDEQFMDFLENKSHRNITKEQLPNLHREFIGQQKNLFQLLQFFSAHNHNHFEHIKQKAEKYLDQLAQVNHRANSWLSRSFFSNSEEEPEIKRDEHSAKTTSITSSADTIATEPTLVVSDIEASHSENSLPLKEHLSKNMGLILEAWKEHTDSIFWLFANRSKLQHQIEDCYAWANWIECESDEEKLKNQQLYIAQQLSTITSKSSDDLKNLCNKLKKPLARFLGIPEEVITRLNSKKTVSSYQKQPANFFDFDSGQIQLVDQTGFTALQTKIKEKINQLYSNGVIPHDYTKQYIPHYSYKERLP